MNIKEVKDLIHDILRSDISEFELEHTGTRVRLRRGFVRRNGHATGGPFRLKSADQGQHLRFRRHPLKSPRNCQRRSRCGGEALHIHHIPHRRHFLSLLRHPEPSHMSKIGIQSQKTAPCCASWKR